MAFTRRDLFWYCAGVATIAVIGLLVHALNGSQNSAPADMAGHAGGSQVASASSAAPAAGDSDSAAAPASSARAAGSMDEMLARLEARLAAQGGSDADWELLAQTYDFVGRTDDAKLARAHKLSPAAMSNASSADTGAATETASSVSSTATISGNIDLAAGLKGKVSDGLTLFIVAKSVDSPGPPVAIIRTTTGHWPLAFTLDDSNSMLPGRTLSSAKRITVEARVSRTGVATPQPGDYQSALASMDAHQGTPVRIVIDHVID